MAQSTIADLPLTDKTISISALLRDLATARQMLARRQRALQIQHDETESEMDEVDTLVGVILQTQALLKQLVDTGLVGLDFEAGRDD